MAQYSFESLRAEYARLWAKMKVIKVQGATMQAEKVIAAKARYQKVEGRTGVPWFVIGCLHMRESNGNFNTWLHNGDPMRRNGVPVQTVHRPKGRPPNPNVSWEDGAYDALVNVENLNQITDWGPEHVAYAAEKFNGFGYRNPRINIPSPYLWGGTTIQKVGKYVADGKFDPTTMDPQIGAMAVLKQIMTLDPSASFGPPIVQPIPDVEPEPEQDTGAPPLSPAADDTESETVKPAAKSKTIWGGILSWFGGNGSFLASVWEKLDNPYTLTAFVIVLLTTSAGLYMIISGRIDAEKIIKHLSQEDENG